MTEYTKIVESVNYIQKRVQLIPAYGIILGTGLGGLVNEIDIEDELSYEHLPHFPISTVEFHSGKLIFGHLGGLPVVAMQGRFHYYEGYSMQQVTFPVRVMKMLGIEKLIISNAAGALNPDYKLSELMILHDHINLQTENPLVGKNIDQLGVRFPDMSDPYSDELISKALEVATRLQIKMHQGVYVGVNGPNLETRAEYNFLRIIGGDAVGMSTVPENIVARQMNIPVFAISVLTDLCYPGHIKKVLVEEVIEAAMKAEPDLTAIIRALISED